MVAFLSVAHRYDLDPFRREIYAFRRKEGGLQPLVGVDGWSSIANRDPAFDGVAFDDTLDAGLVVAVRCRIFRKDRSHPVEVTEYLRECRRNTIPWQVWPARMLRHKAFIQCVRLAFGVSGIMEPDEIDRMVEAEARVVPAAPQAASLKALTEQLQAKQATEKVAAEPGFEFLDEPLPLAEPAPKEAPAEAPRPSSVTDELHYQAKRLGSRKFGALVKKHSGDLSLLNWGLGGDGLGALLSECKSAT